MCTQGEANDLCAKNARKLHPLNFDIITMLRLLIRVDLCEIDIIRILNEKHHNVLEVIEQLKLRKAVKFNSLSPWC